MNAPARARPAPSIPIAEPVGARLPLWWAGLLVFGASCATLVLELVAGRLLSPLVGVSLDTWTAVIGVVLAGISLGSWVGGRVADRSPGPRTVAGLLAGGGLCALVALAVVELLGDGRLVQAVPLLPRIFLLTAVAFLPPSFLLGMVTPAVVRLVVADLRRSGRAVGLVYALGTAGSLAGTFLTGFVLIAYAPVDRIVLGVAAALFALGALTAAWRSGPALAPAPARAGAPEASAPARPRGSLELAGNLPLACAVAALASFGTMVIELAASRVLAPHVGVSLYSWTGIIGVVLAAMATGHYLGGQLADRWPRQAVLGAVLFLGGLASLGVLGAGTVFLSGGWFAGLGVMERIVALTAALFFLPVLVLGTVSPQVVRLALTDLGRTGRVAGRIYAWSTAGAIAGTFATGWWLIPLLGVSPLILGAGLGLLGLGLAIARVWRRPPALAAGLAVAGVAVYALQSAGALATACTRETAYFCIRVADEVREVGPVKKLILDHLVHSYVKVGDPSYLGYVHEEVQAEVARLVAAGTPAPRVLVIGGGGYTFPRWVDAFMPAASVEVVEIDPGVTAVAHDELGLPRDTRIASYNLDGRQFVRELAPRGAYALVVQDAVNDLSVPYHLLTREYNDAVRALLADDGVYLLSVIDRYREGQLLRAVLRTMEQTFPSVQLLAPYPIWADGGAGVFIVAGADRPIDLEELRGTLRAQGVDRMRTVALPAEELRAYTAAGPQIVLTDRYAPVDNLIAGLFRSR